MANIGRIQLTFVIIAPPDQVEEGERIFDSLVKSHGCHGRGYWK